MSLEYPGVTFAKVNVDDAKDVSSSLGISAMPTFKLFRGTRELKAQQGWSEGEVRKMLAEAGAVREATPAKEE
jgi:thioredoxin-like negative regulator of GroEL